MSIIRKVETAEVSDDLTFVLSDDTVDRYGDTIEAAGWDLRWFKRNNIALFGHDSSFPIGTWEDVRAEGNKLMGRLKLAAEGTSPRIDELRRLVEQKVLKAVSVGFKPVEYEPHQKTGGVRYLKQELLETSLVSVPANPAALAVARSLHLSDDTMRMAFGEHAGVGLTRGVPDPGVQARPPTQTKVTPMKTLSQRIEDAQADLVREKDALTAHIGEDDADPIVTEELSGRIEQREAALGALKRAEAALASTAPANPVTEKAAAKPFAAVAKKVEPKEFIYRALVAKLLGHIEKKPASEVLRERYGEDQQTKAVFDVVTRAASAPATTTTTGWAAELVQTAVLDFQDSLMPNAVYPRLSAIGGRFAFGRNGIVSIPSRAATPSVAGSFVAQGAAIPVRQAGFTAVTLSPKKMAVITTFTREIAEMSTPAIEGVLRDAIREDTSIAIDTVLLDAAAATTVRPAGLRNGVTATTAAAGGGLNALIGDAKALVGSLTSATNGNVRNPVWIMNPLQAISISLLQDAGGDFAFAADIGQNRLIGFPVITSSTVPAGTVILMDAADFFSATGDEPRFDVSDQATLHMEDSTPTAIGTTGTPNVVAAPVRSLWQTDTLALRMIVDLNWSMRRTGVIAYTQAVTW